MSLTLVIGSKRWSSWSLRPWIAVKHLGIACDEVLIPLRRPDTKTRILAYSPAGKLPVLIDGEAVVWESLAILAYLHSRFPDQGLWPQDRAAFACATSVSAEMHAGFGAIRRELPMDVPADLPTLDLSDEARSEIARVTALWGDARSRFGAGGPFLFGHFTIADAMFAPVVTRFQTYAVALDPVSDAYARTMLALPAMRDWYQGAAAEVSDQPSQSRNL